MDKGIASDLRSIVGSGEVIDCPDRMSRYVGDALRSFRSYKDASHLNAAPSAVVLPNNAQQISGILRYAQLHEVQVVPYGGGSGVFGAASAIDGGIVLSLDRMSTVLDVSEDDYTGRFEAGVVLEEASRSLRDAKMLLGHDPWSRPIATIGGAISTDGVGYTAARYGSMGSQVLGLKAVLADGEIVHVRGNAKQTNGLSLKHLLIGTEGTFGVITEATVRTFPVPEKRIIASVDFPTFDAGFLAICRLYAEGVRPAMIDFGTESNPAEYSTTEEVATLYISFEGFQEDAETQWARALEICRRYEGREADKHEALRFWKTRHESGERYRRNVLESRDPARARRDAPPYRMEYMHVSLPVSQVLDYRRRCERIFADAGVQVKEWSLWALPEFFSFLIAQECDESNESPEVMGRVVDEVLTLAQELGGAMEYCHGVGLKLSHLMKSEHGGGFDVMRRLKRTVDPGNILNPGKIFG